MNARGLAAATCAAVVLGLGSTAQARPLTLEEVYDLGRYVQCVEACPALAEVPGHDDFVARETCLAACGYAPRLWEKDGVPPVDRLDLDLALLEYTTSAEPPRR